MIYYEETDNDNVWRTFDGRHVPFYQLSHQHLSNIFWYWKLILGNLSAVEDLRKEFNRFNGQILGYQPHVEFTQEIDELERLGYLIWDDLKMNGTIIFEGKRVGSITKPFLK